MGIWEALLIVADVAFLVWIFHRLSIGKKKKAAAREAIKRKNYENLTEFEKYSALQDLNSMYNGGRGLLDYKTYDFYRSKINGVKSFAEIQMQAAKALHTSPNGVGISDIAMPKKPAAVEQAEATKSIVKNAVAGGVIAGPAGAVVGALVGKNKAENKKDS